MIGHLVELQPVDAAQTVCEGGAETRDLVVLVVHLLLQRAHSVPQHLVLVLDHVVTGGHAGGGDAEGGGGHHQHARVAVVTIVVAGVVVGRLCNGNNHQSSA